MTEARTFYTRENNGTGWFVGIIVALALLAIGYLVFSTDNPPVAPLPSAHVKVETVKGHGSATHIGGGYYVTAAHVVAGVSEVSLPIDGLSAPAHQVLDVLWANATHDIALLRGPADRNSVPLACVTPAVGQRGLFVGNPGPLEAITTEATVAGTSRDFAAWKVMVPVDGSAAPGMSGGAFVVDGEVQGVVVGVMVANIGMFPSLYGITGIVPGSVVCSLMARE